MLINKNTVAAFNCSSNNIPQIFKVQLFFLFKLLTLSLEISGFSIHFNGRSEP